MERGGKMISTEQLQKLQAVNFSSEDRERLIDIKTIRINQSLTKTERILQYIDDVHNPYLFKVGSTIVQVQYGKGNQTLQASVTHFLSHQHGAQ